MSVTSASNRRLSGQYSGFDTEQIVKNLMRIEQLKVDRVAAEKTRIEWEQTARQDINSLISDFRTATMSALSPDTNLNTAAAFNTYAVNMTDSQGGALITATQEASAGTYVINEIARLAQPARIASSATWSSLNLDMSLYETMPEVFGDAGTHTLSFSINGESFTFDQNTTLRSFYDTINRSAAGVRIGYSELTGQISMSSRTTGASSGIDITNISGRFFGADSAVGLSDGLVQNGQDAVVRINGVSVSRSENIFAIDGVRYTLVAETVVPLQFTIERNVDDAVERIRHFVEKYNELNSKLQEKLNEKQYRDFTPLSDLQKQEMSEREIELWESKAQSGILRNDRSLGSLLDQMRSMLSDATGSLAKSLASIGISTGSYLERGQLHLDETKLRQALQEDPDTVMNLFRQESDDSDPVVRYQNSGWLQRLREAFGRFTSQFKPARFAEDLIAINKRIQTMNQSLLDKEDRYWRQFSAMEQALSSLYAQSDWLSQNLFSQK